MAKATPWQVPDQLCLGFIAMLVGKEAPLCKTSEDICLVWKMGGGGCSWRKKRFSCSCFLSIYWVSSLAVNETQKIAVSDKQRGQGVARGRQQTKVNCWLATQKVLEWLMLSCGESPDAPGWDCGYLSSCLHCLIPPPLGLTDKWRSFARRGQIFSSRAKSWICLVNLDAPLYTTLPESPPPKAVLRWNWRMRLKAFCFIHCCLLSYLEQQVKATSAPLACTHRTQTGAPLWLEVWTSRL